jgi:hypothetical protein
MRKIPKISINSSYYSAKASERSIVKSGKIVDVRKSEAVIGCLPINFPESSKA